MSLVQKLFGMALVPAFDAAAPAAEAGIQFIVDRFADRSQRLNSALGRAHERTWRTLEMALAGDSLWQRLKGALAAGEEKAMREQVQALLSAAPLPEAKNNEQVRKTALAELQAARSAGLLNPISVDPRVFRTQVGGMTSFGDPVQRLQAEQAAVGELGVGLQQAGHKHLSWLVTQCPPGCPPLLVLSFRYFFRREVETDAELARGLTFSQLEALSQSQEAGLRGLDESLRKHVGVLTQQLAGLLTVATEARDAAVAGLQTALDVKAEQQ